LACRSRHDVGPAAAALAENGSAAIAYRVSREWLEAVVSIFAILKTGADSINPSPRPKLTQLRNCGRKLIADQARRGCGGATPMRQRCLQHCCRQLSAALLWPSRRLLDSTARAVHRGIVRSRHLVYVG
jgi:hypothetical protein